MNYENALNTQCGDGFTPIGISDILKRFSREETLVLIGEPQPKPLSKERALELLESVLTDDKADRLLRMFIEAHDTFVAKDADYGSSTAYTYNRYGATAPMIRITDKFKRLEVLTNGKVAAVQDEKIHDTVLDLGNYCFLWLLDAEEVTDENNPR